MKYITKSREYLEKDCRIVFKDGKFYQDKPRAGLQEVVPFVSLTRPKYGKAIAYQYVSFYNYKKHKMTIMQYGSFLYAWHKGIVPEGYDVDHIDGDTFNNSLDNLQLLTHKENLNKRANANNQYTIIDKKLVEERKLLNYYKDYYKKAGNLPMWHSLCAAIKNWKNYPENVRDSTLDTLLKTTSVLGNPPTEFTFNL